MAYPMNAIDWYRENRSLIGFGGWNGFAGAGSDTLNVNEQLTDGQCIISKSGWFAACLTGGNFYIHRHSDPALSIVKVLGGNGKAARVLMQGDGNLVAYDASNHPVWATNTSKTPARLLMQDDGNLVIYVGNSPSWASNTVTAHPAAAAPARAPAPAPAAAPPPPSGPTQAEIDAQKATADRQAAMDRWHAAVAHAQDAGNVYKAAVAHANRAINAANAHGAPAAVDLATKAKAMVDEVLQKVNASVAAANSYGHAQGFAGFGFGDAADDAASAAQDAASLTTQVGSLADQAEAADVAYATQQASANAQQMAQQGGGGGGTATTPSLPAPVPSPLGPSINITTPAGLVGQPLAVQAPSGSSDTMLYAGLALVALLVLKK